MNVAQALADAEALGLARLDAQLLLLNALGRSRTDRSWLLAHDGDAVDESQRAHFMTLCMRRAAGEPLAYIVGHKEFFGLDLHVDHRVLVPRPDTETLVEWALELLPPESDARVIDLGTGSGAIALAIKKHRPRAMLVAVDASEGALQVASANAQSLRLDVRFVHGDWFDAPAGAVGDTGASGPFDLVVGNPPYVAESDPHLTALSDEPLSALVSGSDGLADIRRIVKTAPSHLKAGGWLLLEHGWDQAAAVRELLKQQGFGWIGSRRDLAGIERCTGARWLEAG